MWACMAAAPPSSIFFCQTAGSSSTHPDVPTPARVQTLLLSVPRTTLAEKLIPRLDLIKSGYQTVVIFPAGVTSLCPEMKGSFELIIDIIFLYIFPARGSLKVPAL